LGHEQPFFGLQSPESPARPGVSRIEDMAALYTAALREVQPAGPYRIGGWSMGALVAFEMARQIQEAGEEVELLALLDPSTPGHGPVSPDAAPDLAALAAGFVQDLTGGAVILPPEEARHWKEEKEAVAHLLRLGKSAGMLPEDAEETLVSELFGMYRHNVLALLGYRPGLFHGRAEIFRATASRQADPAGSWGALITGGVGVHEIPGDHYSFLRASGVKVLAERLESCLGQERG
ncbi:MAG TPA: thioesterase domain-containing protein, partial [Thermoanaerobaculia bacterium]|nr:thioesterase domain-containing protein [Thermoanaerobaculia bacterium]